MEVKMKHNEQDQALVTAVSSGSLEAWHTFVERYAALIHSWVHRYLVKESQDDRRTVFVNTLEALYEGRLSEYDGRAALSTWVSVITRSQCLDHLRRLRGRKQSPKWLAGLSERDRQVYRLYYLEGQSCRQIRERLGSNGNALNVEDALNVEGALNVEELAESLSRIEDRLERTTRRRMAYDLHACSVGGTTGRLLEFFDHVKQENELKIEAQSPEHRLKQREALEGIARMRGYLKRLPQLEREALELHYFEGYSAKRIASMLELRNQRRAYTLIERGLRRLYSMFQGRKKPVVKPD
jgi:DNA-directed RNA polymerase specialized sigma24 family protein